jgi:hypothetical protein
MEIEGLVYGFKAYHPNSCLAPLSLSVSRYDAVQQYQRDPVASEKLQHTMKYSSIPVCSPE